MPLYTVVSPGWMPTSASWRQVFNPLRIQHQLCTYFLILGAFATNLSNVIMSGNIYTEASNILLTHKSGSLKSRIYSAHNASQNSRASPARLYALIMETLKHQDLLNEVIKNSGILSIEKKVLLSIPAAVL